jgi:hypothetical protein
MTDRRHFLPTLTGACWTGAEKPSFEDALEGAVRDLNRRRASGLPAGISSPREQTMEWRRRQRSL